MCVRDVTLLCVWLSRRHQEAWVRENRCQTPRGGPGTWMVYSILGQGVECTYVGGIEGTHFVIQIPVDAKDVAVLLECSP